MNYVDRKSRVEISKADAIRAVTKGNIGISNEIIKDLVWQKFGLKVKTNQIIGLVGAASKRMTLDEFLPSTRKFVELVGSQNAINLIHRVKNEGHANGT